MRTAKSKIVLSAVALSTVLAACGTGAAGDDGDGSGSFYEGKKIEIIAAVGPGGSVDGTARLFAKKLSEHLEGNPTVQVVNIEGGGGILAGNEFMSRYDHDGMTMMLMTQEPLLPSVLEVAEAKYDLADMHPIWAANRGQAVLIANEASGVETVEDLTDPDEELVMGVISAVGANLPAIVALEVLGLLDNGVEVISGYESGDAVRNAFLAGELNLQMERTPGYVNEFSDYPAVYSFGQIDSDGSLIPDAVLPDAPTVADAHDILQGGEPSGEAWDAYLMLLEVLGRGGYSLQTHADVPDEAKEALAAGIEKVVADEEYQEQLGVFLGPAPNEIIGAEVEAWGATVGDLDQSLVSWVQAFLSDKFGYSF